MRGLDKLVDSGGADGLRWRTDQGSVQEVLHLKLYLGNLRSKKRLNCTVGYVAVSLTISDGGPTGKWGS